MNREAAAFAISILTLSDPKTVGEEIRDPLGLARIADQLGDFPLLVRSPTIFKIFA